LTAYVWSWTTYQPVGGEWTYGQGDATLGSFACTPIEDGFWGVGCSNGGGPQWKCLTHAQGNKNTSAATTTICQDQPDMFSCGTCCDATIYYRVISCNEADYVPVETSCGVGACASFGTTSCVNGSVTDDCTPLAPLSNTDSTCDGIDDNCNGVEDENYGSFSTTCGTSVCSSTGVGSCDNGAPIDTCVPSVPPVGYDAACELVPCPQNASNAPACSCDTGYDGTLVWNGNGWNGACSEVDDCENNPCGPGGTCTDLLNAYSCQCDTGYSGGGVNIGCALEACPLHASNAPNCVCNLGYDGTPVWNGESWEGTCVNQNDCAVNPCSDGGICTDLVSGFSCECTTGYSGGGLNIPCDLAPCQPNASGAPACVCDSGFEGTPEWNGTSWSGICEDIDDCANNACGSGGTCTDLVGAFSCECDPFFDGGGLNNPCTCSESGSFTFGLTGSVQAHTIPACVTEIEIETWGAQGGGNWATNNGCTTTGGAGGYSKGTLTVDPGGTTIYIYVGGSGINTAYPQNIFPSWPANYNGGGKTAGTYPGGGGGGASDVRWPGTSLSDRVIVAGGGGGSAPYTECVQYAGGAGGAGGGLSGADGNQNYISSNYSAWQAGGGGGGTQSSGGSVGTDLFNNSQPPTGGYLGQGGKGAGAGSGACGVSGGGGGGYYGGGGGGIGNCGSGGGGGGSSYIGGVTNGETQSGVHSGHGKVIITY